MASQYPPNLQLRLPALILILEASFILIFGFFVAYEYDPQSLIQDYSVFQDVNVMVIFGLAFLLAFLKRYGFSTAGFSLLLAALGVQWAVIVDGFLFHFSSGRIKLSLQSISAAIMSVTSVLVSAGAILGKANLMQLIWMALVEVTAFTVNRWVAVNILQGRQMFLILRDTPTTQGPSCYPPTVRDVPRGRRLQTSSKSSYFQVQNHVSVMHVHLFGASFGLMVSWMLYHSSLSSKAEKEKSWPVSDMFAVLGTLFLWVFWPSFNSALIKDGEEKWMAICNTYFVMAASTTAAFSFSVLTSRGGKISMTHVQNSTLAGGVALGYSASIIRQPSVALALGFTAGMVSVLGFAYLQKRLDPVFKIHDTSGVYYTFGLPALLGGIVHIILIITTNSENLSVFGYSALIETGALCLSILISLLSGLATGFILTFKLWKAPPVTKYFDDQTYWEFPHLAVGY